MPQLSSAPHSARAVTNSLMTRYRHPLKPLASVELLLSDKQSQSFDSLAGGSVDVEPAIKANVERSILDWKSRGDTHSDHLMLFFFCGYAIASGLLTTLLLEELIAHDDFKVCGLFINVSGDIAGRFCPLKKRRRFNASSNRFRNAPEQLFVGKRTGVVNEARRIKLSIPEIFLNYL